MAVSLVTRWFALAAPYPWYDWATQFKDGDGYVGPRWFAEYARDNDARLVPAGPDGGLIPAFEELECDDFHPLEVHPLLREFYRHSATFGLRLVGNRWNEQLGALPQLWYKISSCLGQFTFPVNRLGEVDSTYDLLDLDDDGTHEFVCWIRSVRTEEDAPGKLFYAGAFRPFFSVVDGRESAFLACAFPLPGCNVAAVLKLHNEPNGGFRASSLPDRSEPDETRARRRGRPTARYIGWREAGTYLVVPGRRTLCLFPALGLEEELTFRVEPDARGTPVIRGEHRCYWLGMLAFELDYEIRKQADAVQAA